MKKILTKREQEIFDLLAKNKTTNNNAATITLINNEFLNREAFSSSFLFT